MRIATLAFRLHHCSIKYPAAFDISYFTALSVIKNISRFSPRALCIANPLRERYAVHFYIPYCGVICVYMESSTLSAVTAEISVSHRARISDQLQRQCSALFYTEVFIKNTAAIRC